MRILVVEDDGPLAGAIVERLVSRGGEPRVARSLADARRLVGPPRSRRRWTAEDSGPHARSADQPDGFAFDVALVDLGLPDGSGIDLLSELREARPDAGLVVFTVFAEPEVVFAALRAGARGYLLKSTPLRDLYGALEAVASGGSPLDPAVARLLMDAFAPLPAVPTEAALSPREREVLVLLAQGHAYRDVGTALGIGVGTVQSHVKCIYQKLGVASKAEAAVVASKRGLV